MGPPREAGLALGAANEDEEAVLRAICVAVVESDLDPRATSAGVTTSACTQHSSDLWPDRYDTWIRPA